MNVKKSVLSIGLAIAVMLPSIASNNTNSPNDANSAVQEIQHVINNLAIDHSKYVGTEIKVKFMINENDELIILSTNESVLDDYIKNSLNYKSIKAKDLKAYKVYILPVKFAARA